MTSEPLATCWTQIQAAADGDRAARDEFGRNYAGPVRAYLVHRWKSQSMLDLVEDAVQESFIDLLRERGALTRVRREAPGGFRAFLYGVVRVVALRFERKHARSVARKAHNAAADSRIEEEEARLTLAFDRGWAQMVMSEAAAKQRERAAAEGEAHQKRVELLRLRFEEGLQVPAIAERWGVEAAWVHHQFAQARKEFAQALREVVAFHQPGSQEEIERECLNLAAMLS